MSMESRTQLYKKVKPFVAIILVQLGHAGMSIIAKLALNKGMNPRVFIAYRYAVATMVIAPFAIFFDRKKRAKLTYSVFAKIMLLALLGPVAYQNLYYEGVKLTSATYSRALFNVVPVFTFAMAWILRLEKVNIRRRGSQAKVLGTIVTIGGAMLMTLVKGPSWNLPCTYGHCHQESASAANKQDIKGALMMLAGFFCQSGYIILQAITLESYPTELSLAALISLMGTIESTIVAFAMEWRNLSAWSMRFDIKLIAVVYAGIVTTAFSIYIYGMVIKEKGPVFVTAFSPLSTILVAIMGSFILVETMFLGSVIGAIVIIVGLYMFLWGKNQDRKSGAERVVPTAQNTATADERMTTSNQEFMAINMTSTKSTDGTA
ncbi:WAT1-related protein At2g39510-like [Quercus robur]|uniref:WAT1-related protein At2g39510-like n=1 Tax=Quercus robur TaxID=38942 RepID=UPI002162AC06|nr:WAT1-related protein At2g39510-like [Quercus robur]